MGQQLQRVLAGDSDFHFVPFSFQIKAQTGSEVLLVFNNQDFAHASDFGAAGSCSVNVLPRPAPGLSANARPPCFSATDRTMNRPSPVPFTRIATAPGMR